MEGPNLDAVHSILNKTRSLLVEKEESEKMNSFGFAVEGVMLVGSKIMVRKCLTFNIESMILDSNHTVIRDKGNLSKWHLSLLNS
jgi:hypothetical protein